MVLVLDQVTDLACIIECMLELVFPFDTMGYMTIPYLTLDMVSTDESLIYAPIPFVVG